MSDSRRVGTGDARACLSVPWRSALPPGRMVGAVAVGGAAGASLQAAGLAVLPTPAGGFPWATFVENMTGAFLLGLLLTLLGRRPQGRYVGPLLGTGLLGAYTTFSSFVVQLSLLVVDGNPATAGRMQRRPWCSAWLQPSSG